MLTDLSTALGGIQQSLTIGNVLQVVTVVLLVALLFKK